MFSSRVIAFFALLALATAYPANDDFIRPITSITETEFDDPVPWFRFPSFGNIFAPLTKLFSSFADIGPRIQATDDDFRVTINVKDYKKEDLKVKVKGEFILVQGSHEAKHDDRDIFASQFFHTYSLPENASAADVTANLTSDSFLVIDVPLNGREESEKLADREVPIVETNEPLKDKADAAPASRFGDNDTPKGTTESATTLNDQEDDRKEPTTPSDREELTTKDTNNEANEIPNEVQP